VVVSGSTGGNDVPLRRNRDFRLLWIGGVISQLGSSITQISFALLVLAITGSAGYAGLLTSGELLLHGLITLPAGVWADRFDRQKLMVVSDFVRAVLMAVLSASLIFGYVHVALVIAVAMLVSLIDGIFAPAQDAALKQLVSTRLLNEAAAMDEARNRAAQLIGPGLGGWLFALGRWVPFLGDAISYLVSGIILSGIKRPLQVNDKHTDEDESDWRSALVGIRFIVGNPFLRVTAIIAMGMTFTMAAFGLLFIVSLKESEVSSQVIGFAMASYSIAGLLGATAAPRILRAFSPRFVLTFTAWLVPVIMAVLATVEFTPAVISAACLLFFFIPSLMSMLKGYLAAIAPSNMQGRVFAGIVVIGLSIAPIAPVAFGAIFDSAGRSWAFFGMAAAGIMSALPTLSRAIRSNSDIEESEIGDPADSGASEAE
jgi:MFS family permease